MVVGLFAALIVMATAGAAYAGTITVNLKAHYDPWHMLGSHINPATIYVYGPNKYYKTATYKGWSSLKATDKTVTFKFKGAPLGAYRVRVKWAKANGCKACEANQYFSTWWLIPDHTCDFKSCEKK
jgi:hypothetical protein